MSRRFGEHCLISIGGASRKTQVEECVPKRRDKIQTPVSRPKEMIQRLKQGQSLKSREVSVP